MRLYLPRKTLQSTKVVLTLLLLATLLVLPLRPAANAETLRTADLQRKLDALARAFDGRVGICVQTTASTVHVNPDRRFPMQSVMKLLVAAAVMDAVDHRGWNLEDPVLVRKSDLSVGVQPLAKRVKEKGYRTAIGVLVLGAVVESDSAATDILLARLGGTAQIKAFLARKKITGIRVDRDERHLQTEIVGLSWKPEYVDAAVYEKAKLRVPKQRLDAAYRAYQKDERDTATPKGMADFLYRLASGRLLSPASTRFLLDTMNHTVTFPDRLKAGVKSGWSLGHKTGTSHTWQGVTAATNDVGILTAPDGNKIAVAVFVADSRRSSPQRAALIAQVAREITAAYRPALPSQ